MSLPAFDPAANSAAPGAAHGTPVSLRHYNTFGIDARADVLLPVRSVDDLLALQDDAVLSQLPRLVLGGGSNIILRDDFHGVVLHSQSRGIELLGQHADRVLVRVAAGESWHDLVNWTLDHEYGGLENLSLIPGSVGAAPIQNIGAYGIELDSCVHALSAFDFSSGKLITLSRAECQFGYRDSIFKQALRDRSMILDVTFSLPLRWQPNLRYAELAHELAAIDNPSMRQVSDAVIAIRRRKLPDPLVLGNVGSFFKNPLIPQQQRDALRLLHPQLVSHDQPDGQAKLAAGWLIDQCGWKGRSLGSVGVYEKQALVLVNRGGATGVEVVRLAQAIQADVLQRFQVALDTEPVFI